MKSKGAYLFNTRKDNISANYPALYQTIVNGVKNHVSESALVDVEW